MHLSIMKVAKLLQKTSTRLKKSDSILGEFEMGGCETADSTDHSQRGGEVIQWLYRHLNKHNKIRNSVKSHHTKTPNSLNSATNSQHKKKVSIATYRKSRMKWRPRRYVHYKINQWKIKKSVRQR